MVKWINALYFSCGRMDISSGYPGLCSRPMNTKSCSQSHEGHTITWKSCTLRYLALVCSLMIACILVHCMVVWGITHLPVSLRQLHRESLTFCYTFFSFFSHFSCPFSWEEVKIAKLFALVCLSSIHFTFILLSVTCAIFFLPGFSLRLQLSFITVARKCEIRTNWLLIFFI